MKQTEHRTREIEGSQTPSCSGDDPGSSDRMFLELLFGFMPGHALFDKALDCKLALA